MAGPATAPSLPEARPDDPSAESRFDPWVALAGLLPGALTVYLAFQSGGFFPGATAVATLALAVVLLVRILLAENPFAGVGVPLAVAAGALMLFAAWTLASGSWSDSSARAMLEFDRVLLYLLALILFGSFARSSRLVRWMVWGLAIGLTVVCTAGFITRTLPDFWSAPPEIQRQRLAYPIGYWNALGLAASLALVLSFHITCSAREPRFARLSAAAVCPLLGATLLLTFSRGPLAVAGLGLLAYAIVARPRLLPTGLLATLPTTAFAVLEAYRADLLAEFVKGKGYRFSAEAVDQGHDVALTIALCGLAAVLIRALGMLVFDPALARLSLKRATKRRLAVGFGTLALATGMVGAVIAFRTGWVDTQYERLVRDPVTQTGDYRDRLFNPGLNRLDRWEVALDSFGDEALRGHGAGTYRLLWERDRPTDSATNDAHSLYLEVLAELGAVGAVLLAVALLAILTTLALRARGPGRTLYAALLVTGLVWAVHAGLDWDWEIPAVTLGLFAAGGAALASGRSAGPVGRLGWPPRIAAGLVLVLLAITPARIALSQERLSDGLNAYDSGDCAAATDAARDSSSILGNRPEPYEILAYCEARSDAEGLGLGSMSDAVERDPRNWEFHHGLAVLRARAGLDPRREARIALQLNPREPLVLQAARSFDTDDPAAWRKGAKAFELSPR